MNTTSSTGGRFLTVQAAADYLAVSPRTIRRAIAEGRLTGYRVGPRLIRIDRQELQAMLRPIPTVGTISRGRR